MFISSATVTAFKRFFRQPHAVFTVGNYFFLENDKIDSAAGDTLTENADNYIVYDGKYTFFPKSIAGQRAAFRYFVHGKK